jgi:uncharacterized Zn finger protein
VDAAVEPHPDWVIETCCAKAEEIMDSGRSKYYGEAMGWRRRGTPTWPTDVKRSGGPISASS